MEKIDDVAVKGITDALLGQIVKGFIVTKNGVHLKDDEIYSFCKQNLKTIKFLELSSF